MSIIITGSPGVGKHTIAKEIERTWKISELIDINKIAIDAGLVEQGQDALDVEIERNSFGRQKDSFEAEVSLEPMDIPSFQGVFIRAPAVLQTGSGVETLGKFNEKIIAVKQGNILATSFHPELTRDVSLHKQFVQMVAESKN